jgi:hypothetical protein
LSLDSGRLRDRSFCSLVALNEAVRGLLVDLNDRTLRGWGRSRRQLFDEFDRPALLPLPDEPYECAEWKRCRVNLDYHVEIAKHYYSVPHSLVRQEVEARITARTVEIFPRGRRVASRLRSTMPHRPTTVASTCRARIGATAIGHMSAFAVTPQGSAPTLTP